MGPFGTSGYWFYCSFLPSFSSFAGLIMERSSWRRCWSLQFTTAVRYSVTGRFIFCSRGWPAWLHSVTVLARRADEVCLPPMCGCFPEGVKSTHVSVGKGLFLFLFRQIEYFMTWWPHNRLWLASLIDWHEIPFLYLNISKHHCKIFSCSSQRVDYFKTSLSMLMLLGEIFQDTSLRCSWMN